MAVDAAGMEADVNSRRWRGGWQLNTPGYPIRPLANWLLLLCFKSNPRSNDVHVARLELSRLQVAGGEFNHCPLLELEPGV